MSIINTDTGKKGEEEYGLCLEENPILNLRKN